MLDRTLEGLNDDIEALNSQIWFLRTEINWALAKLEVGDVIGAKRHLNVGLGILSPDQLQGCVKSPEFRLPRFGEDYIR